MGKVNVLLRYQLRISDRKVKFQITEQDEGLRGKHLLVDSGDDGLRVRSDAYPEMATDTVYIRGNYRHLDDEIAYRDFEFNGDRDAYVCKLRSALAKLTLPEPEPEFKEFVVEGAK